MTENKSPDDLQNLIGHKFYDSAILEDALTRRARSNESPTGTENNMDSLATLGDAVLGTVVVYVLYEKGNRQKGTLTEDKIREIKREKTSRVAEKYQLQDYVQWGKGEKMDEIWKKGNRAFDTVLEALIGAVFLDVQRTGKNGITEVQKMLDQLKYFE